MKKYVGFTLAEVLITLAIIGVVAALTIPSVIKNYNRHQINVGLKKSYTILSNALNLAVKDNGAPAGWRVGSHWSYKGAEDFFNDYLSPYINVSKTCGAQGLNCKELVWNGIANKNANRYAEFQFVLKDGAIVMLKVTNTSSSRHLDITIDANGAKKPNLGNRDQFSFVYSLTNKKGASKILPSHGTSSVYNNMCGNGAYSCKVLGAYCPYAILQNSLEIPSKDEWVNKFKCKANDYPW